MVQDKISEKKEIDKLKRVFLDIHYVILEL